MVIITEAPVAFEQTIFFYLLEDATHDRSH